VHHQHSNTLTILYRFIEAIKKGTAFMNVWMYTLRELEDALDDCQEGCNIENCNDDPVHAWDEGGKFIINFSMVVVCHGVCSLRLGRH
jgi:hypothetical protein